MGETSGNSWGIFHDNSEIFLRDDTGSVRIVSTTRDYRFASGDAVNVFAPTEDLAQDNILAVDLTDGRIYRRTARRW